MNDKIAESIKKDINQIYIILEAQRIQLEYLQNSQSEIHKLLQTFVKVESDIASTKESLKNAQSIIDRLTEWKSEAMYRMGILSAMVGGITGALSKFMGN